MNLRRVYHTVYLVQIFGVQIYPFIFPTGGPVLPCSPP